MPKLKKAAFALLALICFLAAAEGIARLLVSPPGSVYEEHTETIRVLGLPDLNKVLEFDPYLFWRLKKKLRDAPVEGRIRDHLVKFSVSTHEHLRTPPFEKEKTKFRILALGDSCTFGVGVEDHQTWPAQLQRILADRTMETEVINAGVPGYTAFQGKRTLESSGLALEPDLVLISFGFNDADVWASRGDEATAEELAWSGWDTPLLSSRLYVGLKRAYAALMLDPQPSSEGDSAGEIDPRNAPTWETSGRPRLTPAEFRDNLRAIKELCDARGVRLVFVVWPSEAQVRNRVRRFVDYQLVAASFCRSNGVTLMNLVEAFQEAEGPLFVDHIHANPRGCQVAAQAIAEIFRPQPAGGLFPLPK